jgi:predicted acetyltransferase
MPTALELRRLTAADEAVFRRAYATWDTEQSLGFVFARGYDPAAPFSAYLTLLEDNRAGRNLPDGFVADTSLFGFKGPELVGMLAIRHELNDFLLRIGGHIGYGVLPPHRGHGYAAEMLRQGLVVARGLGIERALVTCDDNNPASARTIERCGGVYENSTDMGAGKPPKRRYWIGT